MVEQDIKYTRLPGIKRKFIGKDRLWMGPDHLLLAESNGVTENYKRFYFKDIQAINIIKTKRYLFVNAFLILVFLMVTLIGFFLWSDDNNPSAAFFWIISLVLLVYCILNLIKGASCECWLHTFVQKEKLNSIKSTRIAAKAMAKIVPAVEKAQGRISSQSLENVRTNIKSALKNRNSKGGQPEKIISENWHKTLFSLLIIMAVFITSTLYYHTANYLIFGSFLFLCLLAAGAIVVAKQAGKAVSGSIKTLSWVSLVSLLVMMGIGYVEMMIFTIKNMAKANDFEMFNQFWLYEYYAKLDPFENTPILIINLVEIFVCLILGSLGFFLLKKDRK